MRTLLRTFRQAFERKAPRRLIGPRLALESLEDRCLLAGNLQVNPMALAVVEGSSFNGPVATFTDSNTALHANDFTAMIDWGDHTSSAGTVVANGTGGFTVTGTHTYSTHGTLASLIQVNADDGAGSTVNGSVSVADAPLVVTPLQVNAIANVPFTAPVGTFTQADPNAKPSDFTTTINWGDGHANAGTVTANSDGSFTISGGNTYANGGRFPIAVSINSAAGSSASFTTTAMVSSSALSATGEPVQAIEGQVFSGGVAHFTSANPADTSASDFTATVDWGDGHTSTGVITPNSDGSFEVTASNTYSEQGKYIVQVMIEGPNGESATTNAMATVADAALNSVGVPVNVPKTNTAANNVLVATFTDQGGAEPVANYTARIDWGDGTAGTLGTITVAGGTFSVTGSHTYTVPGHLQLNTTIQDAGGSTTTAQAVATVGTQNERFVAKVYLDLLGRPVDPVGLATFAGGLDSGQLTRTQVVQLIENSLEYRTDVVNNLYLTLLGRPADPNGLMTFVNYLGSGGTIGDVKALIISSPEYFQGKGGGTNLGWLQAVYQDILGRPLDPIGQAAFLPALNSGTPRLVVALLIVKSQESNTRLVNGFYQKYLGRPADPDGLAAFVNALNGGMREQDVVALIMGSDEYFSKV
jgi:hypothetical protein